MSDGEWQAVAVIALSFNAATGFGYRVYRLIKGGPMADVWGQAILGIVLAGLATAIGMGVGWVRWLALAYAVAFGVVVMPVWVLAVLLPLRPSAVDYAFTGGYWVALAIIAVASIAG